MRAYRCRTLAIIGAATISASALAADHADGPGASLDKTADIADLYSWVSPDAATTYFVMDIGKDMHAGDRFSNVVKYVFHTTSMPAYGAAAAQVKSLNIICTFDAGTPQRASCWVGNKDSIKGNASASGGDAGAALTSASGKVKMFAGLRDDPFFFNFTGFTAVADTVNNVAHADGGTPLTFDTDGCPRGLGATGAALATMLASNPADGGAPADTFAPFNTLAIVLAVDTTLVTEGGPIVGVWASTNK